MKVKEDGKSKRTRMLDVNSIVSMLCGLALAVFFFLVFFLARRFLRCPFDNNCEHVHFCVFPLHIRTQRKPEYEPKPATCSRPTRRLTLSAIDQQLFLDPAGHARALFEQIPLSFKCPWWTRAKRPRLRLAGPSCYSML